MKGMLTTATLFFSLFLGIDTVVQAYVFSHLDRHSGLSHPLVYDIVQDHEGFLWFATQDGLNRYNAYDFKVFRHRAGQLQTLCAHQVYKLYVTQNKQLWVGTENGLGYYDPKRLQFKCYRHQENDASSLGAGGLWAMTEDAQGNLWVGTHQGGLQKLGIEFGIDAQSKQKTIRFNTFQSFRGEHDSEAQQAVMALHYDPQGYIWVGTDGGGLRRFDLQQQHFKDYQWPQHQGRQNVTSIHQDVKGRLWIGTAAGLGLYHPETEQFEFFEHDPLQADSLSHNLVWRITSDQQGNLWVGTDGGGLNYFSVAERRFERFPSYPNDIHSLPNDSIMSLLIDQANSLWVGTEKGVSRLDHSQQFHHQQHQVDNPRSLVDNRVRAFAEDAKGGLWVGTENGLSYFADFARDADTAQNFRQDIATPGSLPDDRIWALLMDQQAQLWVGTYKGILSRYQPQTQQFISIARTPSSSVQENLIRALHQDHQGQIWVGDRFGLLRLFGDQLHPLPELYQTGSAASGVIAITEDSQHQLWVGTSNKGLYRLSSTRKLLQHYQYDPTNERSLSSNQITAIQEDKQGRIWVGTLGGGLNLLEDDQQGFQHYREINGLTNDFVQGLIIDQKNYLWISSHDGLSRFVLDNGRFYKNSEINGLTNIQFNNSFYSGRNETLFFGSNDGFSYFRPEEIQFNQYKPPIVFTDLKVMGEIQSWEKNGALTQPINLAETVINLSYEQSYFSIGFSALNYINPGKNEYSYWLEGFDARERPAQTGRHADYTKVPPGEYIFHVKAANNDGIWNEKEAQLKINISPPWWRSPWMSWLYVFFGFILAFQGGGLSCGCYADASIPKSMPANAPNAPCLPVKSVTVCL